MNPPLAMIRALWLISAFAFAFVLWFATPRGLGLSPDSVAYLKAVQGLIDGQGLSYFSVQWPPLFSTAIYVASQFTGLNYVNGARLLSAVLYGGTFLLTGRLLIQLLNAQQKWLIAYLFAGLLCLHPVITHIYFYAFSETLFLPFVLLNVLVLFKCKRGGLSPKTSFYLCALGFLATSTRYAGLTLVALNIIMLWRWTTQDSFAKKIQRSLIQLMPTMILLLWWRQHLGIGDTETNQRPLLWHPITVQNLQEGFVNLGAWILPVSHQAMTGYLPIICLAVGVLLVIALLWPTLRELFENSSQHPLPNITSQHNDLTQLICVFAVGYLVFLVCMRSLFDPNIVLDPRTLAPIFLPITSVLVTSYIYLSKHSARIVVTALLVIIYALPLQQIRPWLLISYFNGIELNDKNRLNSELLQFLRTCSKTAKIYADQPWNINLEFQSMVHWLPTHAFYGSWLADPHFQTKVKQLTQLADLIVIEDLKSSLVENIEDLKAFRRVYNSSDGLVWQHAALNKGPCR